MNGGRAGCGVLEHVGPVSRRRWLEIFKPGDADVGVITACLETPGSGKSDGVSSSLKQRESLEENGC